MELSRNLQIATAAIDSTGMCLFIAFPVMDQPETFQALVDMLNAFYGLSMTADDVTELGKSILHNERDFNARAGLAAEHDRLPDFFKKENLPPHDITFQVSDEDLLFRVVRVAVLRDDPYPVYARLREAAPIVRLSLAGRDTWMVSRYDDCVLALRDPSLGVAIAVAIALHNIPEGISVSVPIFYATGDRKKAFVYSFLSGLAEPVGAVIAYAAIRLFLGNESGVIPPQVMGILFGGVAGIMVYISLDELLPTSRAYGKGHDSLLGLLAGMAVMALSLLLMQ